MMVAIVGFISGALTAWVIALRSIDAAYQAGYDDGYLDCSNDGGWMKL